MKKLIIATLLLVPNFFISNAVQAEDIEGILYWNGSAGEFQSDAVNQYDDQAITEIDGYANAGEYLLNRNWYYAGDGHRIQWSVGWREAYTNQPNVSYNSSYVKPSKVSFVFQDDGTLTAAIAHLDLDQGEWGYFSLNFKSESSGTWDFENTQMSGHKIFSQIRGDYGSTTDALTDFSFEGSGGRTYIN